MSFYGIDVKKSVTKLTEEEGEGDRGKGEIKRGKRGKRREGGEGGVRRGLGKGERKGKVIKIVQAISPKTEMVFRESGNDVTRRLRWRGLGWGV